VRTIIGAESFHGPVRDGKGWVQLAMVVRRKGSVRCATPVELREGQEFIESNLVLIALYKDVVRTDLSSTVH
jgi:hypothetical protein